MSIGVGFPRAIPQTPNGNQQLGTLIVAAKGTSDRTNNIVTGLIAAKEGYSCRPKGNVAPYNKDNYIPTTNCMGFDTARGWPSSRQQNFLLLSERGAAYSTSPYTRVQVKTVESGLGSPPCISRDKLSYIDPQGNPVPQRACTAS